MNQKISVLLINPSANLGGGNTISNNLASGLDKNIFEVFTLFPEKGPAVSILKEAKGINILTSPKSNLCSILFFLYSFLKNNKIDIVHAQGTRAAFWTKLVFLFLRKKPKFIYTLHGLHIAHRPFFQKYPLLYLERVLNVLVDRLVCPSLSVKSLAEKYKIIKKSKIDLIYNGIDIKKFATALPLNKKTLDVPENFLVVSAIQRLNFPKDVSTILRAFRKVTESFENVILLIVGDGPLMPELKKEAKNLNIEKKVLFLGERFDIENILAISDIVILSSSYEALGLSLIETMAAKKPVIGTNVEGIKEIIEHGKNGFLVNFGDKDKMAEYILLLLNDSGLRQKMGENGFEFVKAKFFLEKMLENYQNLYFSILK
jgi:glycosyltransferase involved in cell wall biosynthesis